MIDIRPAITALVTGTVLLSAAFWLASRDPAWLAAHSPAHWPVAVQVVVGVILGALLLVGLGFWGVFLWALVMGAKDEAALARANHRFANESTSDRIIVARYNIDDDRDVVLDVPLSGKRLWLAPSTGFDSFSVWQYVALLDHAPLYRRQEDDPLEERNDQPFLDCAHKPLWTGNWHDKSKSAVAHREAVQQAIDAGAVTLHVTPNGWEPAIPADAKFRTDWHFTPTEAA